MANIIAAYMRISTNKAAQKTDRQRQAIGEYAQENGFRIDQWHYDRITGAAKADSRPGFTAMRKTLRKGDTLIISDLDRLGRNADDVIVELKRLKEAGIRVVALDIPYMNEWGNIQNDSLYDMIVDILITLKAHMAQQEKEKIVSRINQGLEATKARGTKLGRPKAEVPKEFIREYKRFKAGEYGKITAVQFSKMQGIGRSTFYKYASVIDG